MRRESTRDEDELLRLLRGRVVVQFREEGSQVRSGVGGWEGGKRHMFRSSDTLREVVSYVLTGRWGFSLGPAPSAHPLVSKIWRLNGPAKIQ